MVRVGTAGSRCDTNSRVRAGDLRRTRFASRERLSTPRGEPLEKHGALSDHQRLIRHLGVAPLIYQYGETVITPRERQAREAKYGDLLTLLLSRCRTVAYTVRSS